MVQLGQHAPPIHVIAHVSDTHLLGGGRPLYGAVDTDATVARAFALFFFKQKTAYEI